MNLTLKKVMAGLLIAPAMMLGITTIAPASAMAVSAADCTGETVWDGAACADPNDGDGATLPEMFKNIINAALYIIGAVSVLMIIYGGIRYTISAGNATNVTAAKNTIMYAVVGLIVALLAYAIVNWVLGALGAATA